MLHQKVGFFEKKANRNPIAPMPDVKFEIKTILEQGIRLLRNFDCGNYKLFLKNDLGSLAGTLTGLWQTNSNQRELTLQDTKQGLFQISPKICMYWITGLRVWSAPAHPPSVPKPRAKGCARTPSQTRFPWGQLPPWSRAYT